MLSCPASPTRKDFDGWNRIKKKLDGTGQETRLYFHEGDIWWAHVGVNVGYEIDGKHADFSRPVVVLKKYNQYSFLALPLTTNANPSRWRVPVGMVGGVEAFAVLSQLRNLDSLRLIEKKGHIRKRKLAALQKMASLGNFGWPLS